ncbi:MAG: hypothetical protein Q8T09_00655 [Candidatus Melainabacteria bacterium]|nr:hypothetical protein [Candidatus Melainabacteria bacterium]
MKEHEPPGTSSPSPPETSDGTHSARDGFARSDDNNDVARNETASRQYESVSETESPFKSVDVTKPLLVQDSDKLAKESEDPCRASNWQTPDLGNYGVMQRHPSFFQELAGESQDQALEKGAKLAVGRILVGLGAATSGAAVTVATGGVAAAFFVGGLVLGSATANAPGNAEREAESRRNEFRERARVKERADRAGCLEAAPPNRIFQRY